MSQTLSQIKQKNSSRIDPRIFLLALGMFALGTDAFVVSGVLPVIAKETGVTEGLAGQLVTVFSLTYGLGAPILAALTSRWSRNRVLIGALGLFCLANVASALAPTFAILLITRILTGCFAAIYAPLAYTTGISLAPPEKRGQALALVIIGLTVATALGSPMGTWVGEHYGWHVSFEMVAGLGGVAFLVLLLCGLPKAATPSTLALKARLAPIAQPQLLLALLPALLWNLGFYTVYTYIALLIQHNMHISDISGLLVVSGLGVVIGNWSGGRVADRFGANRPLLIGLMILTIIEVVLSLVTTTLISTVLMLFIWSALPAFLFIPQQQRLLNIAPEHANVILALNNSMFYLGIAGGAALGGLSLRAVAVTELGWIGTVFILLALLVFTVSVRMTERKAQESKKMKAEKMLLLPE